MAVRGLDYFFNCRKEKWEKENDLIKFFFGIIVHYKMAILACVK